MVIVFCLLLIAGIIAGQSFDFSRVREVLTLVTSICLAYIMIEVGLEFSAEKKDIKSYGWDALVAFTAAVLPAFLWFLYFWICIKGQWQSALVAGLSSAPTSAGVLFSIMMAAGLSATWVFKKARVLAVLDDLVTILLLVPLQIIVHGFEWESITVVTLILMFLFAAFRWQNAFSWPVTETWLLGYAVLLTGIILLLKQTTNIHLEVLVPAFMLGCLMRLPHQASSPRSGLSLDTGIKGLFMFLVGLSFPRVEMGHMPLGTTVAHVLVLTVLSNIGKSFCMLCYRREASLRQRLALGVAMFPRGEVGAAVLLIGLRYGLGGYENTLAMLSLAFNLMLTGMFIWIVIKLLHKDNDYKERPV